jgi:hypothetical protein
VTRATRRRKLLDTLGVVSGKLETLLAGQNLDLASLPLPQGADPSETPLERLRRFKELLQVTLTANVQGEHPACRVCGRPIPELALDELPWATTCGCAPG